MGDFSHPNHVFREATVALDKFRREIEIKNEAELFPTRHTYFLEATPHMCVKLTGM